MPNWVHNSLEVKGDPKILDKIEKDFTKKKDWHWTDYFPVPKELENISKEHWKELDQMVYVIDGEKLSHQKAIELIKKYGSLDSYDWAVSNWGIKWGDCETEFIRESQKMIISDFDSPWSTPVPMFMNISKKFPTLEFHIYHESWDNAEYGTYRIINGEVGDWEVSNLDFEE